MISIINQNDVDAQVSEFTKAFIKVWDAHAPFKKRRVRISPTPWMNKATLQSIHSRDAAYRVYLHDRSPLNLITYKKLRNETKRIIRLAKREFFTRGSRSGTSYFWKKHQVLFWFRSGQKCYESLAVGYFCTSHVFSK